ncbi:dynactin arp1 p25 subunit [Apiospora sp. TS-2023a]
MSAIRALVVASLAAVAVADGLYVHSNELAAHFAKRQKMPEPGTPAYNCHDNCGQSIIASRGKDPCHDKTFLTDYAACLSCAGPDNYGIWMYYGAALSKTASSCNLPTTPGTDMNPDVPLAIPAAQDPSAATSPTTTAPKGATATTDARVSTTPSSTTSDPSTASSSITHSTSQPTSPTVPTAGASSAVCLKLYAIFLLTSNLLFASGF